MSTDRESSERRRPRRRRARLVRSGLPPGYERVFNIGLLVLLVVFASGWAYAVADALRTGVAAPRITRVTTNPLSPTSPPEVAYLLDAALRELTTTPVYRGRSGDVRVVIVEGDSIVFPDLLPDEVGIGFQEYGRGQTESADTAVLWGAPERAAIWNVLLQVRGAVRSVPDLSVITLVPLSEKRGGRIGSYRIGQWPFESGGKPPSAAYAPPPGLVRVTPENQDLRVSRHFRLRDFLTKGQIDVWPKYVALSRRLLDKLELTIDELEIMGHPVTRVGVISGFRTPVYNESGGNPAGRGALSRHMYGDAMDFYIDNDGDGRMDDLNGDGRIDTGDGRVIVRAAERVEQKYPDLIGGIGLYKPTGAHSGFVHIDTRGYRARW